MPHPPPPHTHTQPPTHPPTLPPCHLHGQVIDQEGAAQVSISLGLGQREAITVPGQQAVHLGPLLWRVLQDELCRRDGERGCGQWHEAAASTCNNNTTAAAAACCNGEQASLQPAAVDSPTAAGAQQCDDSSSTLHCHPAFMATPSSAPTSSPQHTISSPLLHNSSCCGEST
jgi:hypothetical protein